MIRKAYTLGLATLLFTAATAQRVDQHSTYGKPRPVGITDATPEPAQSGARGGDPVIVWSEDFSNGFAGSNPNGAWTTDGPNGNIWVRSLTAPRGAFTPNNQRIASSTFSNGFAKFASDSANCTWNGNTPTAIPTNEFVSWEGSLVSPIIDLSATPFVEIEFQQRSRYCCGDSPFFLEISTDGGFTWPTVFLANDGLDTNQDPTFTETRRFNLTSVISEDPTMVRFRFHHNSEAGSSHYYWQVDDINIQSVPDYEMVMNYGYTSTTGLGEEYGRIPLSQLPEIMNLGAEIFNYGGLDQTGVMVNCSVTDESDVEVFAVSTDVGTIAPGDTVVTDEDVILPTLPLGLYTATFTITSDQIDLEGDPSDNTKVRTFEVTDHIYSLDNLGNYPAGTEATSQVGTASFTDNAENVKLLTMYYLNAPMTVYGMEIALGAAAEAGSYVIISIIDTVDALGNPAVVNQVLAESDLYTLTAADVSARRAMIPLLDPIELDPNAYYAVVSMYADGNSDCSILDDTTVPQPALASALWIPFDPDNNQNFYGGNGTAWALRLNSNPTLTIGSELELEGVSMFPNPTTDNLYIRSTQNEKYNVQVMNMLGEQVMTNTFATTTTMNLSDLASGVYSVRVSNGTQATVQLITVQ